MFFQCVLPDKLELGMRKHFENQVYVCFVLVRRDLCNNVFLNKRLGEIDCLTGEGG